MYNVENKEKKYNLDGLITPTRKTDFDDSDVEDEEEIGFDPPPVITPDVLSSTPVIRLTTPIRNKEPREEKEPEFDIPIVNDENINTYRKNPSPRRNLTPVSPVLDISDEEEINERVLELTSFPGDQDYSEESKVIREGCMEVFRIKFGNLKVNYPEKKIEFPEGKKLERVHKIYHSHIKSIYVDMNLDQIQLSYVICLMVFEFLAIKAFGIPMAGFTKMELKRMYKYQQLMIEIGEEFYTTGYGPGGGGKKASIEYRIFTSFASNVIIFIALKLITKYMGGESMTGLIRGAIDKIIDNPVTVDNIESGTASSASSESDGLLEDVLSNGSNITEILANLGTSFTEKMENKGKVKETKKSRVIFNE